MSLPVPYQIAQLTGVVGNEGVMFDWPRGLIYMVDSNSGGLVGNGIKVYTTTVATQATLRTGTLPVSGENTLALDPLSGDIIGQDEAAGIFAPVLKINPTSFAVTGSLGASGYSGSYPTAIRFALSMVCVQSGAASYAVMSARKDAAHEARSVVRVDTMTQAGFYLETLTATDYAVMCAGVSGVSGGSVFLVLAGVPGGSQEAVATLLTVTIAPLASTYDPTSWPATNPYITASTVGTISPTALDALAVSIEVTSLCYDATDGNILLCASTERAGGAATQYIVKVSSATAAVLWSLVLLGGANLLPNAITTGTLAVFTGSENTTVINTLTGASYSGPNGFLYAGVAGSDSVTYVMLAMAGEP